MVTADNHFDASGVGLGNERSGGPERDYYY